MTQISRHIIYCSFFFLASLIIFHSLAAGHCHRVPGAAHAGAQRGRQGGAGVPHPEYVLHHGRRGHLALHPGCLR